MIRDRLETIRVEVDFWPEPYKHVGRELCKAVALWMDTTNRFATEQEKDIAALKEYYEKVMGVAPE